MYEAMSKPALRTAAKYRSAPTKQVTTGAGVEPCDLAGLFAEEEPTPGLEPGPLHYEWAFGGPIPCGYWGFGQLR
jgi:hypothetical protein